MTSSLPFGSFMISCSTWQINMRAVRPSYDLVIIPLSVGNPLCGICGWYSMVAEEPPDISILGAMACGFSGCSGPVL